MGFADSAVSPWFATATINAPEARYALSALLAKAPDSTLAAEGGVVPAPGDPFKLTSVGTASAPAWSVAPGQVVIQRPVGGTYVNTWDVAKSIAVDLPLPASGQTRRDLVVTSVLDPEADSGDTAPNTRLRIYTVPGSASSSPTLPAVPPGTEPLWSFTVSASGALSGVNDMRRWTRGIGGIRFVQAGDTRSGSFAGDMRVFPTGQLDAWLNMDGTGWKWITIIAASSWTQQEPSLVGAGPNPGEFGLGSGGTKIMRWKRVGNDLTISYAFRWGAPPFSSPGGNVTTFLPNGWVTVARDQWIPCQIWVNDTTNSKISLDFAGLALVQAGSNILRPYYPRSNGSGGFATGLLPYRVATGAGPGNSIPFIASGYAYGGTVHIGPATIELAA